MVLAAGAACDTLTGNGESISIANGSRLDLPWRDTVALTVLDDAGSPIRSDRVTWSSGSTGVARVTEDGVVSGEEIGSTVIRATVGSAEASIRVNVVVEGAEDIMRIRITGDVEEEYLVRPEAGAFSFAVGLQAEFLDRPEWRFGYVLGETYSLSDDIACGVTFAFPGELTEGSYRLDATAPADLATSSYIELGSPIAYLHRETGNRAYFVYPVTSGSLDITALDSLSISFADASVRGTATFEADEYRQTYDPESGAFTLEPTGRSVQVEIIFHVPAGIYHGGFMDVTASGGTYAAEELIEGWADGRDDPAYGTALELSTRDADGGQVSLSLGVADPVLGATEVGPGVTVRWRQYTSAGAYIEGGAESGTVTFTELVEPTTSAWGVARGTLDVTLRVGVQSDQAVGEALAVAGTFAVPIAPKQEPAATLDPGGAPSTVVRGPWPGKRPWATGLRRFPRSGRH